MKKISFIMCFMIAVMLLSGCMVLPSYDHKAVDDYSKAVKEGISSDDFYFDSKRIDGSGASVYDFEIREINATAIGKLMEAANNALPDDGTRICILVSVDMSDGMYATLFQAKNYSDDKTMLDGMENLHIVDQTQYYWLSDPNFYSEIKGIKVLEVDGGYQDKAEDAGIDWYAFWPELEKIRYSYHVNTEDEAAVGDMIDRCNKALSDADSHKTSIDIDVYDLFNVKNYSEDNKSYDGSNVLTIVDKKRSVNNGYTEVKDPSLYSRIDGIKELYITEDVQKYAEDTGIDWHTYWPDLETIEVIK